MDAIDDEGRMVDVPQGTPLVEARPAKRASVRVLLVNFTLDDDSAVLAHQAAFARKLAARVAAVHVVTELLGRFERCPENMTVTAIPRRPFGVPRRLGSLWLALPSVSRDIARFRPDACFVHMAHEWCYRLGPLLRRRSVPILLWYSHKQVSLRLRAAASFAERVVTATAEGFRLDGGRAEAIGHGIDVDRFALRDVARQSGEIISVGRVTPIKRLDLIVKALAIVHRLPGHDHVHLRLIGPALTEADRRYREQLIELARNLGIGERVEFVGPLPQGDVAAAYCRAVLHVNVTNTGGLDKSVLEALACGCPVLTSNAAFFETIRKFPAMAIVNPTAEQLADRIAELLGSADASMPSELRELILGRHDLDSHVDRIVDRLTALAGGRAQA